MMDAKGYEVLRNPFLNKGTGFTLIERKALGLTGTLPSQVQTIDEQAEHKHTNNSNQRQHHLKSVFS